MDHIRGDGEVVVKELDRPAVVSKNASDFCRGEENRLRMRPCHPQLHLRLAREVDRFALNGEKPAVFLLKAAN